MSRRALSAATSVLLAAPVLALAAPTQAVPTRAAPSPSLPWCGSTTPAPCIQSASVVETPGGSARPVGSGDPAWQVSAIRLVTAGARMVIVQVNPASGGYLPASATEDVWSVTLDLGTWLVPRVIDGRATAGSATRTGNATDGYHVTVSGKPVLMTGQGATGGCDQSVVPWTCKAVSLEDEVQFNVFVDDFGQWTDATQRESFYGLDYWTNIEANGLPPQLQESGGVTSVIIDLANTGYYVGGTRRFQGFVHERIPNALLQQVYGVPDPASMTGTSLVAAIGGAGAGSATVAQEPGDQAMLVDLSGVTFPVVAARGAGKTVARSMKVKRAWLVSRVAGVKTARLSPTKGRVRWAAAHNQGARVTGYQVRCTARGLVAVKGRTTGTRFVSTGFRKGHAYTCRVRATWRAGTGRWSVARRLAARP